MGVAVVIQWPDREEPEAWEWPGEDSQTLLAATTQLAVRLRDRAEVGGKGWIFKRKCGSRRMVLEGQDERAAAK